MPSLSPTLGTMHVRRLGQLHDPGVDVRGGHNDLRAVGLQMEP